MYSYNKVIVKNILGIKIIVLNIVNVLDQVKFNRNVKLILRLYIINREKSCEYQIIFRSGI